MHRPERALADPRTVAREIVGVFDTIFPQLVPGLVAYLNRDHSKSVHECKPVPIELVEQSQLQRSMLFEIAVVGAELKLAGNRSIDWPECLCRAVSRQRRYFDATLPDVLNAKDKEIAELVADNLVLILNEVAARIGLPIEISPQVPGFRWVSSGFGDFSCGDKIIEVKCTNKRFSSADYRQIVVYWLLSYLNAIEKDVPYWKSGVLVNPRLNVYVDFRFDFLVPLIAAGRSPVQIVEMLGSMISDESRETLFGSITLDS